jgi:hypothetical protein
VADPANLSDADVVIDLLEDAARTLLAEPRRTGCSVRLPARGRLLATGDLHDNPFHLRKVARVARLDASPDHHVVVHELIHGERLLNGMDFSYRMLARVAELVMRHPGQVHPLLANHELAQMTGRGVSKGAGNSVELFLDAVEYTFGDRSEEVANAVNDFIRAMPLALRSEDGVMCAHSLPAEAMMKHFDADVLERELADEDYLAPHGAAYLMTWGRRYTDEQVDGLAERWGVRLFCLGHEHAETGIEVRGPRVLILNTDHEHGTVVPIELDRVLPPEEAMMYAVPLASVAE